jgi:GntR family transcriptional regulator/MocR family aminotransferase
MAGFAIQRSHRVVELKRTSDLHSPLFEQLALGDLIETGAFDRHIRRTRQLYKTRRDRLVASLSRYVRIGGIAAGQHAALDLPQDCDEARLIEAGARRSLGLYGLARFRIADGPPAPSR